MANSLDKKGFMYNKLKDGRYYLGSYHDEVVELNSNSNSGSVAFNSIYHYYITEKSSVKTSFYDFRIGDGANHYSESLHGIRPLFLFKE